MSVQLVVYPQWYDGVPSAISTTPVSTAQRLGSPADFSAVASGTILPASVTTATMTQYAIVNYLVTMLPNAWYGFSTNTGLMIGAVGSVAMNDAVVFQRMSTLVVGGLYDVKITWDPVLTPQSGKVKIYDGTILQSTVTAVPDVNNEATVQFTANSTMATFAFEYIGTLISISSMSVKGANVQPPSAIQVLENGQVICDLYEDEDIPLTLSVDNFKNAAEQVHSYSKAFNLPGTKRNNQIFDNMFEVTRFVDGRSTQFNPLVRTKAILKQDGILLFEGFLRMLDITDKEGEISYNVNLYSEVIALADTLKDRTFADLDFSELDHDYDISNITLSWTGLLPLLNPLPVGTFAGTVGATTTGVLKYPFVDWNHQYEVNLTSGNPELPNLESAFRPCIKLKYIIDMIFNSTEFNYTSDFFNSGDFKKLYMDFNWGSGNAPVVDNSSTSLTVSSPQALTTSFTDIAYDVIPGVSLPASFGLSGGVFIAQHDGQMYNVSSSIFFESGVSSSTLDIQLLVNGVVSNQWTQPLTGATVIIWNALANTSIGPLQTGETWSIQAKYTGGAGISVGAVTPTAVLTLTTSAYQFTNDTLLETLRGELGQWDFLKGIMTMFNLITMPDPDDPNTLIIEPYSDVFIEDLNGTNLASRGIQHDWTEKIDASEMKLAPLADLNKKTIFKFEEDDDDFCFSEYKRQVQPSNVFDGSGHLYGSKIWDASDLTLLEGEEEISAEPFAATIPAPLMSQYSDFIVPKIYASDDGTECQGFDNAPRIMYDNGVHTLTSCTYKVPAQNGGALVAAEDEYLRFSHLTDVPTILGDTFDYNFGACQLLPGLGAPVAANLFNIYWLPYYAELYNPNTRIMNLKVDLSAGDISTFEFNDKVMIKNRAYRVNKIDYKPNDLSNVEFILIG